MSHPSSHLPHPPPEGMKQENPDNHIYTAEGVVDTFAELVRRTTNPHYRYPQAYSHYYHDPYSRHDIFSSIQNTDHDHFLTHPSSANTGDLGGNNFGLSSISSQTFYQNDDYQRSGNIASSSFQPGPSSYSNPSENWMADPEESNSLDYVRTPAAKRRKKARGGVIISDHVPPNPNNLSTAPDHRNNMPPRGVAQSMYQPLVPNSYPCSTYPSSSNQPLPPPSVYPSTTAYNPENYSSYPMQDVDSSFFDAVGNTLPIASSSSQEEQLPDIPPVSSEKAINWDNEEPIGTDASTAKGLKVDSSQLNDVFPGQMLSLLTLKPILPVKINYDQEINIPIQTSSKSSHTICKEEIEQNFCPRCLFHQTKSLKSDEHTFTCPHRFCQCTFGCRLINSKLRKEMGLSSSPEDEIDGENPIKDGENGSTF